MATLQPTPSPQHAHHNIKEWRVGLEGHGKEGENKKKEKKKTTQLRGETIEIVELET